MTPKEHSRFKKALRKHEKEQWSYEGVSELALQMIGDAMRRQHGLRPRLKRMKLMIETMLNMESKGAS